MAMSLVQHKAELNCKTNHVHTENVRHSIAVSEMLPYSTVAAIDYAAYQSRSGLSASNGTSFTHSWLVPTQEISSVNFKPNQQQPIEPGHVSYDSKKGQRLSEINDSLNW
ncbi:CLUMA_CG010749, isoform A [Clunio marinus]|uniref:CLUMA_CG010749, isoform A n=1 Tax=Clunio marinus TaxID=568069 RepID=A0A1J1IED1_9DIPT|nr:CLUMA_CG010749, isoform A [Clunio marinus]